MKNARVLLPVLTGCLGFALGLMSGRKDQDGNGNAVLYWLLIAALGLGLAGGAIVLYKHVANGK